MPPIPDPLDGDRVADSAHAELSDAHRTRRLVTRALLVALPLLAVAAAWWLSRDTAPRAAAGGHDHPSMAATGDSAQPVMLRYDLPATTRASFYVYNDLDDVERLADAIRAVQRVFGTA